ncbi:MAG: YncE family protein [Chitinispirillaceae bacterium]|jgi:DNA-binding beta-propeller fold protein YncE
MQKVRFLIVCLISCLFVTSLNAQTSVSRYKIASKIHVEGEGGLDYLTVDDSTGRLFVSHGTIVQVVDTKTGKLIGTIPNTIGVHGIALAQDLNKGFISNGKDSSVTIFNLKTLEFITKVPVTGQNPDAILYDKFSQSVFAFNGKTVNATVINAKTNKVISTIILEGKPEFPASNGSGTIYVNIEDKSLVEVINVQTLKVENKWPLTPGEEPTGMAIDNETHRLFIGCSNKLLVVLDAQTGKVDTTLPIGDHVDAIAFDPGNKRAYSSNGDGTLTVVQEENKDSFKVIENIVTQKGARTLALNGKTHHLYLPTAEFGPPLSPTAENPKPRPTIKPGSFVILDVEPLH